MDRLVGDELFEHRRGRVPGDAAQFEQAHVENLLEQVPQVSVDCGERGHVAVVEVAVGEDASRSARRSTVNFTPRSSPMNSRKSRSQPGTSAWRSVATAAGRRPVSGPPATSVASRRSR